MQLVWLFVFLSVLSATSLPFASGIVVAAKCAIRNNSHSIVSSATD